MDESFTPDADRTHKLCEEMIRARIQERIHWLCETRVDRIDPDLLRHMKAAGCAHVSFGVESGSQEILDKNHKRTKVQQAFDAVRWAKEAGIPVDTYYVLGLPYENRETLRETRRFALKADPDFANFFILVPYPGTQAMKLARAGKANMRLLTEDWSQYGIQIGGAMELGDVPRARLERFQLFSYLSFYLRPSKWRSLMKMVNIRAMPVYMLHQIAGLFRKRKSVRLNTGYRFVSQVPISKAEV